MVYENNIRVETDRYLTTVDSMFYTEIYFYFYL